MCEDASARREPGGASLYVVQAGDTLAGIAAAHGLSVLDLLEANPGVGGNLACLRSPNARANAATTGAAACNPFLQRFLRSLRWCWHLHGCFRRRRGGERERALIDTAQAQLDAAGRGLVEDIVRRASAAREECR
ncbi:LysM domain-containing protein [Dokdonella sp.]|uniref:LysM peptidoglycan-binding domain-containing protein n=1 Tax=Dokdonella sp. TaxID=2291710 RepID=UPI001B187A9E|nr:LysM domain-containing protein [Dokdonella sp.]MBO9663722.1 LysM peptidoglycan-binding domain-containing protein [Dokdonella sp.]